MKTNHRVLFIFGAICFCAASVYAQQVSSVAAGAPVSGGLIVGTVSFASHAVTGEPYSATTETEMSQTLADGTHIDRHTMMVKTYRDSLGRTRTENYLVDPAVRNSDSETPQSITISDPVAQVQYALNPHTHVARQLAPMQVRTMTSTAANVSAPATPARPDTPLKFTRESLGFQTMEGLLVEGTRNTTTIPVGAQGNDRPMEIVSEDWTSKELGIVVLATTSDPRAGTNTRRMTNISRDDPDPSLFQVPADYTIDAPTQ
jgi:hypothetical protein